LTEALTGDIIDCTWEDNRSSGLGVIYFGKTKDSYKGQLQDKKFDGFGMYYSAAKKELFIG
jgi:hypothetical protein